MSLLSPSFCCDNYCLHIKIVLTTMGRSWVAVEQTLKFLPLARVRNDIVYEPEASRQCHSLREQEEEISMSARLPPRNDIVSIYVKPPLNKWVNYLLNRCFGPLRRSRYIYIFTLIYNSALALTFVVFNHDCTKAWHVDGHTLLDCEVKEVSNRNIRKGEKFFHIPIADAYLVDMKNESSGGHWDRQH